MNDLNDIILSISIDQEEKEDEEKEKEEELNQKEVITLTEEHRFNNLLIHLQENLSKRFYKKTIKEIESLIEANDIEGHSRSWKIYILKIRAILSIIKNKITKYLVNHVEKMRIKHHINTIKKYLNKIPNEFSNFYEINKNREIYKNIELINDLLYCYLEYILLLTFYNKRLGNAIEYIGYLSFVLRLYKETRLIPKTKNVLNKLEECFLALINAYIVNEDYSTAVEYLNIVMDMCLKDIIFNANDISDGVFKFEKDKYKPSDYNEKIYKLNDLKRIVANIIFVFLYRSICYENTGDISKAVKCDYQSIWFLNHFYSNSFKYLYYLFRNILEKRVEFKYAVEIIQKRIKYYDQNHSIKKKEERRKEEQEKEKKSKSLFSKKFKNLVNKLENLKIPEIDLVDPFEEKKFFKGLNSQIVIGKDKNNFLYGIRLFNTYLREDFRPMINSMKKIKSFDIDYQTQEKIQKFVRKMYLDQKEQNIKINQLKEQKKINLYLSLPNFKKIKIQKNILKNRTMSTKNTKKRIFSSISRTSYISSEGKMNPNSTKNKSLDIINNYNNKKPLEEIKEIKKRKIPKYKVIKLTSICDGKEVYKENEKLNKFFNRNYLAKRAYIKNLEDRELIFQKYVLREKNHPKIPFTPFNKELSKQKAINQYDKILSLSVTNAQAWKDNMTKEEYRKMRLYNRLENIAIGSLNKSALIMFKEVERKMRNNNKFLTLDEDDNYKLKVKKGNKSMIEKLNYNLEQIEQRENIETKNFKKLYEENKKYIKHRNERNSLYLLRKEKEKENEYNFFD